MEFSFTSEQAMLRDSVRSFVEDKVPPSRVRELMETEDGFDQGLWDEISGLGWPAMHIPEELGGAGFTTSELGIVLEETGAALTPIPLFSSIVLGANLVLIAGDDEQRKRILPDVAAGARRLSVALVDDGGTWDPASIDASATPSGGGFRIDGAKSYVIDGHTADTLIVAATVQEGDPAFFVVDADTPGVERAPLETLDMTRKQARVVFDGVQVDASARLAAGGSAIASRLYDLAAIGLAYEAVGGAQRCLDMSVDYAKTRKQFGRAIGSFQAIKHMCADMLVDVESARSAAHHAGWAVDHDPDEVPVAAALAKAHCVDAFYRVAGDTIQVHGGIGFTWEHDAHLYFKRARTSQLMFGDGGAWRAALAGRLGL
jgi:alkylation response protein AidB-like acyl-CoA dehydrogenase